MAFQIPDPEVPTEIEGPGGQLYLFRHFQLVHKEVTSFDSRIAGDVKTAKRSHSAKCQMAMKRFRGVEPIDLMMEVIVDWTEGAEVTDDGRELDRYGRICTILSIPGNFMGKAGEDGLVERVEALHMPENGIIQIPG